MSAREGKKLNSAGEGRGDMVKFDVKAFTLTCGITWGLFVLFLGWAAMLGWGTGFTGALGSLYIGYNATFLGSVIGLVWAFFDGAIGGLIFAFVYNAFAK